jgi:hypothetical protein
VDGVLGSFLGVKDVELDLVHVAEVALHDKSGFVRAAGGQNEQAEHCHDEYVTVFTDRHVWLFWV